ncbi:hypothetical protein PF008_g25162 [Phytophthora fragariae]|uniref:RxLR effector protein n=1 Tax=Phytophthora fragariae TaxID=53985 RepID=A0A6G0QLP5_9STRA|nr:hypothetical protein PF008_g25162 [Phytophthora fragariae]
MASRKPAAAAALAGIIVSGLASADVLISVQYDAVYSLPEYHDLPCSGDGAEPVGRACPKAGDVAVDDCNAYLPSYNGTDCVAPVDAECGRMDGGEWGCAFLTGYASASGDGTVGSYDAGSSGWGTSYDEGVQVGDQEAEYAPYGQQVGYDATADTPLNVKCEVDMGDTTTGTSTGDYSPTTAPSYTTESTEGGEYGYDNTPTPAPTRAEGGDYGYATYPAQSESSSTESSDDYYSATTTSSTKGDVSYATQLTTETTEGGETVTYGSASTGSAVYTTESTTAEGGKAYVNYGTPTTGTYTTKSTTTTEGSQTTVYYSTGSATYTTESDSTGSATYTQGDYGTSSTGSATESTSTEDYSTGSATYIRTEGSQTTVDYSTGSAVYASESTSSEGSTGSATYTSGESQVDYGTSSTGSATYTTSPSEGEQTSVDCSTESSGSGKTEIYYGTSIDESTTGSEVSQTSTGSSGSGKTEDGKTVIDYGTSTFGSDASTSASEGSQSTEDYITSSTGSVVTQGSNSEEDCESASASEGSKTTVDYGTSTSGTGETVPATEDSYTKEGEKAADYGNTEGSDSSKGSDETTPATEGSTKSGYDTNTPSTEGSQQEPKTGDKYVDPSKEYPADESTKAPEIQDPVETAQPPAYETKQLELTPQPQHQPLAFQFSDSRKRTQRPKTSFCPTKRLLRTVDATDAAAEERGIQYSLLSGLSKFTKALGLKKVSNKLKVQAWLKTGMNPDAVYKELKFTGKKLSEVEPKGV